MINLAVPRVCLSFQILLGNDTGITMNSWSYIKKLILMDVESQRLIDSMEKGMLRLLT